MAVVIGESEVMPLLRAACPSFEERWRAHVSSNVYEEGLLYLDLAELAHHLVELMRAGTTTELPAVFEVIERLHLDGTDAVKEAATIGLLEDLQNLAQQAGLDVDRFAAFLQPESSRWWAEVAAFWRGEIPYVGAGLKPSD